jgi:hypothetical protein
MELLFGVFVRCISKILLIFSSINFGGRCSVFIYLWLIEHSPLVTLEYQVYKLIIILKM